MAISDTQKVDYLFKKIGYGISKTDTSTVKSPSNESIASPLLVRGDTIWQQSNSIPSTIPSSNSSVVNVYSDALHSTVPTTNDSTASTNRTWKTGLSDWIDSSFGSTYQVKVYVAPTGNASPQTYGTQLFADGTGSDEWFFDYQSGVLNFIGTSLPTVSFTGNTVYVSGARYVGSKGITTIGGINFNNNTISTVSGNLYISSPNTVYLTSNSGYINANGSVITNAGSPVNSSDLVTLGYLTTLVGGTANTIYQGTTSVVASDNGSIGAIKFTVLGNIAGNITSGNTTFFNSLTGGNILLSNGNINSLKSGNLNIIPQNSGIVQVISSSALGIPYGNTATRPVTPVTGYLRYNTDSTTIEYWNGTSWNGQNQQITSQVITPDGILNYYTLTNPSTTTGVIVTINGTIQQPSTAYNVSGNVITFAEIPASSDIVEVRTIASAVSISGLSAIDNSSSITLGSGNVIVTGNVIAPYFVGNGAFLTGLTTSNYSNANVASYLTTYTGAFGNLASGISSSGTIQTTGIVYGNSGIGGTLLTAAQTNITSLGALTGLNVSGTANVTNTTNSTAYNNGALVVAGGLGVAKDVYIQGNLYVSNILATSANVLTVTEPLLYLYSDHTYPLNYDIGFYSHYTGGPANVYAHTGLVKSDADNKWYLFSNISEPLSGQVGVTDANVIYDQLVTGSHTVHGAVTGNANITQNLGSTSTWWNNTYTGNLYAPSIYGTLLTAAQTNITSVGTLSSLNAGAILSTSSITGVSITANTATGRASFGTDAGGSLSIGQIMGTATTPYIDFNTSATVVDYDVRIMASGNVGTVGKGDLTFTAGNVVMTNPVVYTSTLYNSGSIYVNTNSNATAIVNNGTNGSGNIGSVSSSFNTVFAKATTALYADLAENYLADNNYEPGTVLEFGGEYEVTVAQVESDRVAGIVSTNPAYLMNSSLDGTNVISIALQGRVPCKVVGSVKKGDMLTSAGNGLAMVSTNKIFGSIIGKSLQDFIGNIGIIEVVVGRL
jgi:hypothetical protein